MFEAFWRWSLHYPDIFLQDLDQALERQRQEHKEESAIWKEEKTYLFEEFKDLQLLSQVWTRIIGAKYANKLQSPLYTIIISKDKSKMIVIRSQWWKELTGNNKED